MKSFIIVCIALFTLASCDKTENCYTCQVTKNGQMTLTHPGDTGCGFTKSELNKWENEMKDKGYSQITCQIK